MSRDEAARKAMKKVQSVLNCIRANTSQHLPLQVATTFVVCSLNEGKGVVELADMASVPKGTMSRHLLDLSDRMRSGEEGHGLLQRSQDPSDLRQITYVLTPKGKHLRNQITEILED